MSARYRPGSVWSGASRSSRRTHRCRLYCVHVRQHQRSLQFCYRHRAWSVVSGTAAAAVLCYTLHCCVWITLHHVHLSSLQDITNEKLSGAKYKIFVRVAAELDGVIIRHTNACGPGLCLIWTQILPSWTLTLNAQSWNRIFPSVHLKDKTCYEMRTMSWFTCLNGLSSHCLGMIGIRAVELKKDPVPVLRSHVWGIGARAVRLYGRR